MPDSTLATRATVAAAVAIRNDRRQLLRRTALVAGTGLLMLAVRPLQAQTATPSPAPVYGRRRRGLNDVLWVGGALAVILGGIVVLGSRARRKNQQKADQKAELAARLAACREKSRSL